MNIKITFGKRIKTLRKEKSISQEQLALKAEIDRTYIQSIEKGLRNVSITIIEKIAKALDIKISELMEGIEDDSKDPKGSI